MTIDAPRPDLPPIRTQADLTAVWTTLMGELGFASRSLWVLSCCRVAMPARR